MATNSNPSHPPLIVSEIDGSPKVSGVQHIKINSGTLTDDGSGTITIDVNAAGDGNVMGAAASTDNAVVRFNGTNGKTIQGSQAFIADDGSMTLSSASVPILKLTHTGSDGGDIFEVVSTDTNAGKIDFEFTANGDPTLVLDNVSGTVGYYYLREGGSKTAQLGTAFGDPYIDLSVEHNLQLSFDSLSSGTGGFEIVKGNGYNGRFAIDGTGLFSISNAGLVSVPDNRLRVGTSDLGASRFEVATLETGPLVKFQTTGLDKSGESVVSITGNTSGGPVIGSVVALQSSILSTGNATIRIQQGGSGNAVLEGLITGPGDVQTLYNINGGVVWATGLDNSDDDSYKIDSSATLGNSTVLRVSTGGDFEFNGGSVQITATSFLGIGTTPTIPLHVFHTSAVPSVAFDSAAGDQNVRVTTQNINGDSMVVFENSGDGDNAWAVGRDNGGTLDFDHATGDIITAGTRKTVMRIQPDSGDVTLGTADSDGGDFTIVKGAQTGDPQVTMAVTADASGDFSINADTGDIDIVSGSDVINLQGKTTVLSTATAGGSVAFSSSPGDHTSVTGNTLNNDFQGNTITASGDYGTQAFTVFQQPTITAASTQTIDEAGTLIVAGAPIAAGSAIITSGYSLWSQDGVVRTEGDLSTGAFQRISVSAGLTASTDQTQGQIPLTTELNIIGTVANSADAVTLPNNFSGIRIQVLNNGANPMQVFPASGDDLGAGVNNSTTIAPTGGALWIALDGTNWAQVG